MPQLHTGTACYHSLKKRLITCGILGTFFEAKEVARNQRKMAAQPPKSSVCSFVPFVPNGKATTCRLRLLLLLLLLTSLLLLVHSHDICSSIRIRSMFKFFQRGNNSNSDGAGNSSSNNNSYNQSDRTDEEQGKTSTSTKKKVDKKKKPTVEPIERKKFVNIRYHQWLYDRINGVPRPPNHRFDEPDPYPPSFLCLPPPIMKCCPWLWEDNCLCTSIGRLGCCSGDESWARNAVMRYAIFLNLIGLLLMVYACLSIASSHYIGTGDSSSVADNLLSVASLAHAKLTPEPDNFFLQPILLNVGLTAMLFENPNDNVRAVIPFDQFCNMYTTDHHIGQYLQSPVEETCGKCHDVQPYMVLSLLVATICFVPSICGNCTRMYLSTDVNCQKCGLLLVQFLTVAGCVSTYYLFTYECFRPTFYSKHNDHEVVSFNRHGQIVEFDAIDEVVQITFDWTLGYGMLCLFAAFGIKVIDFLCNCCTPTPAITRNTYEQKIYEQKAKTYRGEPGPNDDEDAPLEEDEEKQTLVAKRNGRKKG